MIRVKIFFVFIACCFCFGCKRETNVVPEPPAAPKKYANYLIKKGSITLKLADTTVTFTAPQDEITYTTEFVTSYYSLVVAVNKKTGSAFNICMADAPWTLKTGSDLFPFEFQVVKGPNKSDRYAISWISPDKGVFNIKRYDTAGVLFEGDFDITASKNYTIYSKGETVKMSGSMQLYK